MKWLLMLPGAHHHSHPRALPCSLGILVRRVNDPSLELMVKQLTTKLLNPKKDADVQRETAAIGIKAVVQEVSNTGQAAVLVQHATGQLLAGVQREVMLASQAACLLSLARCLVQTCQETGQGHRAASHRALPAGERGRLLGWPGYIFSGCHGVGVHVHLPERSVRQAMLVKILVTSSVTQSDLA